MDDAFWARPSHDYRQPVRMWGKDIAKGSGKPVQHMYHVSTPLDDNGLWLPLCLKDAVTYRWGSQWPSIPVCKECIKAYTILLLEG